MTNEKDLTIIMHEMKNRNLFFIDSRTTSDTRGEKIARHYGSALLVP